MLFRRLPPYMSPMADMLASFPTDFRALVLARAAVGRGICCRVAIALSGDGFDARRY